MWPLVHKDFEDTCQYNKFSLDKYQKVWGLFNKIFCFRKIQHKIAKNQLDMNFQINNGEFHLKL